LYNYSNVKKTHWVPTRQTINTRSQSTKNK